MELSLRPNDIRVEEDRVGAPQREAVLILLHRDRVAVSTETFVSWQLLINRVVTSYRATGDSNCNPKFKCGIKRGEDFPGLMDSE